MNSRYRSTFGRAAPGFDVEEQRIGERHRDEDVARDADRLREGKPGERREGRRLEAAACVRDRQRTAAATGVPSREFGPGTAPARRPYHRGMNPPDVPAASDGARYLNRELSMLDFQARVLAYAEDPSLPLLERAKFLAIFSGNVDEFFQVRVAGLKEQVDVGRAVDVARRSRPGRAAPRGSAPASRSS